MATLTIISSDNVSFSAPAGITAFSPLIADLVEDIGHEAPIMLPNVHSSQLAKIIDYCAFHMHTDKTAEELEHWDKTSFDMSLQELSAFVHAVNYMHIDALLKLVCSLIANQINEKSYDELRAVYGITEQFTPEQEEEIRLEREWVFGKK